VSIALLGFILHVIFAALSAFLGIWTGSQSPIVLSLLLFGAGLIWGIVFIHLRQKSLVTVEAENLKSLKEKASEGSRLFDEGTYDSFSAEVRLKQMERWFLPGISFLTALYMIAVPLLKFAGVLLAPEAAYAGKTVIGAVGIAGIAFILFIFGRYAGGLAVAPKWRFVEAGGAISIFCAICSIVVSFGLVMIHLGLPKVESFLCFAVPVAAGVIGIELVLNFILHIYRPPSVEYSLPYSSRMLRMLARPSGALKTVAEALDYQFGFQISQTWFYRFVERAIAPIILFQIIAFYGLTCIVVVNPEEKAVIERFGVPSANILGPGFHLKLPWPAEKALKYPTGRIQMVTIGVHGKDGHGEEHGHEGHEGHPGVVLWTVEHGHGSSNLIVASSEMVTDGEEGTGAVPVNFLNTSVDIQYCIDDLLDFLYKKKDPVKVLKSIASRELVRFMVSVDLFEIMGPGRLKASEHLASRIRDACRDAGLGLKILYIGFENVHPPVEVAGAFEEVVGAIEEKHTKVFDAEAYRNKILPLAEYQQMVLETEASAYKFRRETVASARADQFIKQYSADESCMRVYRMRKFLGMLEENLGSVSKYIVPEDIKAHRVTIIDMKQKLRPELLDIDLTETEEER